MPAAGGFVGVNNGLLVRNGDRAFGQHGTWCGAARHIQLLGQDAHIGSAGGKAHHEYQLHLAAVQFDDLFLA